VFLIDQWSWTRWNATKAGTEVSFFFESLLAKVTYVLSCPITSKRADAADAYGIKAGT
jgi:hypothetical protein